MSNKNHINPGIFADPTVDFAFKRIFGTQEFKQATIGLINSIIKDHSITDVTFLNVEMPRETAQGKTSFIDVLCEDTDGNSFIVEMQKIKQPTFRERMVYYASRVIGLYEMNKGEKEYKLGSTYVIAFLCFDTDELLDKPMKKDRYSIHYVTTDELSMEKMPGSPEYFLYDLPRFTKTLSENLTEEEFWLFLLKEAKNLDSIPDEMRNSAAFTAYFEAANRANFTPEEALAYEKDMMTDRDIRNGLAYAEEKGRQEGRQEGRLEGREEGRQEGRLEGREEGREEGRQEEKLAMAKTMKLKGYPVDDIAQISGLPIEQVQDL